MCHIMSQRRILANKNYKSIFFTPENTIDFSATFSGVKKNRFVIFDLQVRFTSVIYNDFKSAKKALVCKQTGPFQ